MATIVPTSCTEYRHKKFDKRKRTSDNSEFFTSFDDSGITESGDSPSSGDDCLHSTFNSSLPQPKRVRFTSESSEASSSSSSTLQQNPFSFLEAEPNKALLNIIPSELSIPKQTLIDVCKYHENMARKFPKKQRNPIEQKRRDKNTLACRLSRRVAKLEEITIEEQYKEFKDKHFEITRESMRATAYLSELLRLTKQRLGSLN